MNVSEDRISEALRQGRIGKFRAWWERRQCRHEHTSEEDRAFTDGIDKWKTRIYWCGRCGCWWNESSDPYYSRVVVERPRAVLEAKP